MASALLLNIVSAKVQKNDFTSKNEMIASALAIAKRRIKVLDFAGASREVDADTATPRHRVTSYLIDLRREHGPEFNGVLSDCAKMILGTLLPNAVVECGKSLGATTSLEIYTIYRMFAVRDVPPAIVQLLGEDQVTNWQHGLRTIPANLADFITQRSGAERPKTSPSAPDLISTPN